MVKEADMVIFAIGQTADLSFLPSEIKVTKQGTIAINPQTMETTMSGVFAGGDIVMGPSSVMDAIAAGKRAAAMIDIYLRKIKK